MMPVEDGKISCGFNPIKSAAYLQTSRHALIPRGPVAQFALPELTSNPRILPRVALRAARSTSNGAAATRFLVNTAAAVVPEEDKARAKSGRPLALMPAATAEKENP